MTIMIRPAQFPLDINSIVDIHMKAFPGFFLTLMGCGFVAEYYRCVLEYPNKICLVACLHEHLIGFVVGFAFPHEFYSFYRSKRARLIPWIILGAIRRPALVPRIIWNIGRVSVVKAQYKDVELSSIAVLPGYGRKGVARLLMYNFVQIVEDLGNYSIYLTTDADENDNVNAFYRRQGFHVEKTFHQGKRKMNIFRFPLI